MLTESAMNMEEQQQLRERTAALVFDWGVNRTPTFTGDTPKDYVDAIVAAHVVADEARLGMHRWVGAARRSGLSWADVGDALGISKQAAQQRFRPHAPDDDFPLHDGEEIVRLGATAFNELAILRDEGLKGRELIRTGALTLVFRPTGHPWEYRRRIGTLSMVPAMQDAGWTYVSSWIPFHYFKRPLPSN
jgi:hypothetical protein